MQRDPHLGRLKSQKENPSNMADARVWIGGLVRNGATDTPILNAKLKIKESNFSKKAAFVAKWSVCLVQQKLCRNLSSTP